MSLDDDITSSPYPSLPAPPRGEPWRLLDWEEIPDGYGEDVCGLIARDPKRVFVYWEVTDAGRAAAGAQLQDASARLAVRLFITVAEGSGIRRELRDVHVDNAIGRRHIPVGPAGATIRAAVGLLVDGGAFVAIANSPPTRLPWDAPASPGRVDWLEVLPPAGPGRGRLVVVRRGATSPGAMSRGSWTSDGSGGVLGGASSTERPHK